MVGTAVHQPARTASTPSQNACAENRPWGYQHGSSRHQRRQQRGKQPMTVVQRHRHDGGILRAEPVTAMMARTELGMFA